jgi:hypothetical protein
MSTVIFWANQNRVKDVKGKAVLHFGPVEQTSPARSSADVFDYLLGAPQKKPATPRKPSQENVQVRLEYDDTTIGSEAAAAYLSRFQHHLEFPTELVL